MLKPTVDVSKFEKFGFKKAKGEYGKVDCYYRILPWESKIAIATPKIFEIQNYINDDPSVYKSDKMNIRVNDRTRSLELIYDLIKANMLNKLEE